MKNRKYLSKIGTGMMLVLTAACLSGCSGKKTETEAVTEAATQAATEAVTEAATEAATEAVTEAATEAVTEAVSEAAKEAVTEAAAEDTEAGTVEVAGWKITVEDHQLNESLENISVELGYTGVETSDFEKTAEEGKTFCLVKLLIEKDGSKEKIVWDNMKLTDAEGNEYPRMADDFLTDLGMKRMAGNDLNFGTNEGWIAFEINEASTGLALKYAFESEEFSCEL